MKGLRRHRLTLALAVSLLLHLVALGAPGWHVPTLGDLLKSDADNAPRLEAHLEPLAVGGAVAARHSMHPRMARRATVPMPQAMPLVSSGVLSMPAPESATDTAPALGDGAGQSPESAISPGQSSAALLASATSATQGDASHAVPGQALAELKLPRRGSVRFSVSRGDQGFVVGQSTHHWNHDGKTYVLNSVTETTGLIALFKSVRVVWLSQGEIGPEGLLPHEFHTEKDGVRGDAASFDWESMKLALSGGPQREVKLVSGSQDVLSMFYQLSNMLPALTREAGGASEGGEGKEGKEAKDRRSSFSIYVTTGRKLERYRFEVLGEERVMLRQRGSQRTLHLRTPAGDQTIDIWLGLDLRGLPLKIRYTDGKGDSFDQKAEEIEFEGMTGSSGSH